MLHVSTDGTAAGEPGHGKVRRQSPFLQGAHNLLEDTGNSLQKAKKNHNVLPLESVRKENQMGPCGKRQIYVRSRKDFLS